MSGVLASKMLKAELTELEQKEILEYDEVYFIGRFEAKKVPCASQKNYGYDDDKGNYLMAYDDHLDYRYEIRKLLGRGSFGQVVECFDHKRKVLIAIKVVTNASKFRKQSKVEVAILEFLNCSSQSENIVRMKACFSFRSHICIVQELLSSNLYQLSKLNKNKGFTLPLVKRFTEQLVSMLAVLSSYRLVHCDLKPENVLLSEGSRSLIKVVDFGSSCYEAETIYTYIQSRYYRAPEVILGLPYGCPIDMWSLGCFIIELINGIPLFIGDCEADQLLAIMEVFGLPPQEVLAASPRFHYFFTTFTEPIIRPNRKGILRQPGKHNLDSVVKTTDRRVLDFISRCLDWSPTTRLNPQQAIEHPWLAQCHSSERP
jgi:dual specificity tyrosine-phosphorylation-regulated kinase 2/3/4